MGLSNQKSKIRRDWIPAFAGMTKSGQIDRRFRQHRSWAEYPGGGGDGDNGKHGEIEASASEKHGVEEGPENQQQVEHVVGFEPAAESGHSEAKQSGDGKGYPKKLAVAKQQESNNSAVG